MMSEMCMLICASCAFCASHKQKKQIIEKHCLLGKSNPFCFSHAFCTFLAYFACENTLLAHGPGKHFGKYMYSRFQNL
jgi:hypothetical protein